MRKICFIATALVCTSFASNAQILKGSTFIGGSLNVNTASSENDLTPTQKNTSSNWSLRPQFGKAISTNKILGVFLNYGSSKNKQTLGTNNNETDATFYGGGIFYRGYYPVSNRFFLFGESALGVAFGKNEGRTNNLLNFKGNSTEVSFSLTPGISFAASKKLHLEAALNSLFALAYQDSKRTDYNSTGSVFAKSESNQFNANVNASGFSGISVGLRWILPSKK